MYATPHAKRISLDLKKSKGLSAALCFKKILACLLLSQQQRNANTNAREAAGNKQLLSKAVLGDTSPSYRSTSPAARLTEIRDCRGCGMTTKKIMHVVSSHKPLGMQRRMRMEFPWISKSQRVCRQHSASKISEPIGSLASKRGMQMPTL